MAKDITIRLQVDGRDFNAKIDNADDQIRGLRDEIETTKGSLSQWGMAVTGINQGLQIASQLISVMAAPVELAGQFEQYEAQLKVMLGSTEAAKARLEELVEFAATTPFELPEVISLGNRLQSIGQYSKELMTDLGDLASASGKDIDQVFNAYAKLATGQMGEAVNQFRDLLISDKDWENALNEKGMTKTAENMQTVLHDIMVNKGFGGMMDEQAKTMNGAISNMNDSIGQFAAAWGNKLLPLVKGFAQSVGGIVAALTPTERIITNIEKAATEGMKQRNTFIELSNTYDILATKTNRTAVEQELYRETINKLNTNFGTYLENINLEKDSIEKVRDGFKGAREELELYTQARIKQAMIQDRQERLEEIGISIAEIQLGRIQFESAMRTARETLEFQGVQYRTLEEVNAAIAQSLINNPFMEAYTQKITEEKEALNNEMQSIEDASAELFALLEKHNKDGAEGGGGGKVGIDWDLRRAKENLSQEEKEQLRKIEEEVKEWFDLDSAVDAAIKKGSGIGAVGDNAKVLEDLKSQAVRSGITDRMKLLEFEHQSELERYADVVGAKALIDKKYLNMKAQLAETEAAQEVDIWFQVFTQMGEMMGRNTAFAQTVAAAKALMNTYEAVTEALPNLPLAFAVGTLGALQVANIMAIQPPSVPGYKDGGIAVGENGPEIIYNMQSYAEGQALLVSSVMGLLERSIRQKQIAIPSAANVHTENMFTEFFERLDKWNRELKFGINGEDLYTSTTRVEDRRNRLKI